MFPESIFATTEKKVTYKPYGNFDLKLKHKSI